MLYNRLYVPVIIRNFLVPLTSERDETKIGVSLRSILVVGLFRPKFVKAFKFIACV